jgi:hypothetical protein
MILFSCKWDAPWGEGHEDFTLTQACFCFCFFVVVLGFELGVLSLLGKQITYVRKYVMTSFDIDNNCFVLLLFINVCLQITQVDWKFIKVHVYVLWYLNFFKKNQNITLAQTSFFTSNDFKKTIK